MILFLCSACFGKISLDCIIHEENFKNSGWICKVDDCVYMSSYGSGYLHKLKVRNSKKADFLYSITDPNMSGLEGVYPAKGYLLGVAVNSDSFLVFDINDKPYVKKAIVDHERLNGAECVYADGDLALVCNYYGNSLTLISIKDILNPFIIIEIPLPAQPLDVKTNDGFAYVTTVAGKSLVSVDLTAYKVTCIYPHTAGFQTLDIDEYLYATTQDNKLIKFNISDPCNIRYVTEYHDPTGFILDGKTVDCEYGLVFVTSSFNADNLNVYNSDMRLLDTVKCSDGADGLWIDKDAYISCWGSGDFNIVGIKGLNSYKHK